MKNKSLPPFCVPPPRKTASVSSSPAPECHFWVGTPRAPSRRNGESPFFCCKVVLVCGSPSSCNTGSSGLAAISLESIPPLSWVPLFPGMLPASLRGFFPVRRKARSLQRDTERCARFFKLVFEELGYGAFVVLLFILSLPRGTEVLEFPCLSTCTKKVCLAS